jgi:glycosyltransferase involved in cell wall biosynthesis
VNKTILLAPSFLADSRYWIGAAFLHPPGDPGFEVLRGRAAAAGCPLIGVPDRGPLDLDVVGHMLRICRRLGVRVWHGHDYKSNLIGLLLRPFHPMKMVSTVHGWVQRTPRTRAYFALDRASLRFYDQVICVSDPLFEQVGRLGVPAERRVLVRNGVDERTFRRQYPAERSALRAGVPAGRLVVGALGRLSPEKGFDTLIRASGALLDRGLDFELWIAGEGPLEAELRRLIAALGLGERVRLLGYWSGTVGLYHALDALALSSVREGLPNVLLEALAMQVPVVATSVGGVPWLVRDGESGLLCPPGVVGALANALGRLLADAELRARLGQGGRALIEREFTLRARMAQERAVYDRVLGLG